MKKMARVCVLCAWDFGTIDEPDYRKKFLVHHKQVLHVIVLGSNYHEITFKKVFRIF